MHAVRVDPKIWFSAERTFLHWAKISVVFAAAATLLITTAGSNPGEIIYSGLDHSNCIRPVKSGAACASGAAWLGLTTAPALSDGHSNDGTSSAPPYCYREDGILKFNSKGVNTGECNSDQICICEEVNINWLLYAPAVIVDMAALAILGHAYRKHLIRLGRLGSVDRTVKVSDFADKGGAYMIAATVTLTIVGLVTAPLLAGVTA
mmetsp:Transcript_3512/g.4713  ORF Transcript_3512/g.4713 Transcript_3512/m.4713 type:complete len:206 (+) Transcript_3512:124-741(+)|eukprot:CAMPEP_0194748244 /NCGR_PEP_ID=MMETSP0323_2-20130528/2402_1 /TAXON_ID=2866 ORGANISM="Crypthecodinium cohnii, Strain Seligo" /NCGR_SAMPLE_ID=MMETSP0323_2 /ASSEMBLY_ACC=CAM_ASM_000346 /LENGTH=205 /DNA_ID=CAMNT_0039662341 /DNA_START=11 /DNA_END=628 /DNA_ORIENTATION=-